jgi:hypothetical protein
MYASTNERLELSNRTDWYRGASNFVAPSGEVAEHSNDVLHIELGVSERLAAIQCFQSLHVQHIATCSKRGKHR